MGVFDTLKAILFCPEKALQPIWPVEKKASCMEKTGALCHADVCGSQCLLLQLLCGTADDIQGTSRQKSQKFCLMCTGNYVIGNLSGICDGKDLGEILCILNYAQCTTC